MEPLRAHRANDETSCHCSVSNLSWGCLRDTALQRFVLPTRDEFSSLEEFERYSGPLNWNRQQGIYIYRADRLVQWGGWNGIRGIDEHTKLARASLDFDTDLDSVFNINVAKMRVTLPPQIRQMMDRPINELCSYADDRYRKALRRRADPQRSRRYARGRPCHWSSRPGTRAWTWPALGAGFRSTPGLRCGQPPCWPESTSRSANFGCPLSEIPDITKSLGLAPLREPAALHAYVHLGPRLAGAYLGKRTVGTYRFSGGRCWRRSR